MSVRVMFKDGQVIDYPEAAGVSRNAGGTLMFVNSAQGHTLAVLVPDDVQEWAAS